jgi:hypothetical protein
MHSTKSLKFVNAKQASIIYEYKNIRRKLYKTNAAIWFNKTCRLKEIKPNYTGIRINGSNKQCHNITKIAIKIEIRRYMNKIEIVTSVGFSFHMLKGCMVQKA